MVYSPEYGRELREGRRQQGLCTKCGNPNDTPHNEKRRPRNGDGAFSVYPRLLTWQLFQEVLHRRMLPMLPLKIVTDQRDIALRHGKRGVSKDALKG